MTPWQNCLKHSKFNRQLEAIEPETKALYVNQSWGQNKKHDEFHLSQTIVQKFHQKLDASTAADSYSGHVPVVATIEAPLKITKREQAKKLWDSEKIPPTTSLQTTRQKMLGSISLVSNENTVVQWKRWKKIMCKNFETHVTSEEKVKLML